MNDQDSYDWDRQERMQQHTPPEERTAPFWFEVARQCRAPVPLEDSPVKDERNEGGDV